MDGGFSPPTEGWVTPQEYAERTGRHIDAVYTEMRSKKRKRFIREMNGRLELHEKSFRRMLDPSQQNILERAKERKALMNGTEKKKNYLTTSIGPSLSAPDEYVDYLQEKRKWSARCEELKYRKYLREVVSAKAVAHEAATVSRLARDQLMQIADRLAGQLINVGSYDEIFNTINMEMNRVLHELTKGIQKLDLQDDVTLESDPQPVPRNPEMDEESEDEETDVTEMEDDDDDEDFDEDEEGEDDF